MNKQSYIYNQYFQIEIENIFKRKWYFACLSDQVSRNNDFVTVNFSKYSIVVQNFNGELRAFENVCSHRFNRIQTDRNGNRPLQCRYHAWTYGVDGLPRIPKKKSFDIADIHCLKLKEYKLSVCGSFLFVNLDESSSLTLNDYLGPYYQKLIEISQHFGSNYNSGTLEHLANWKLLVENVLEGYHCPLVHTESLVALGYCLDYPNEILFYNGHSSWHSPRTYNKVFEVKEGSILDSFSYKHNSFYHLYIYPNLFISSTSGGFFYIGRLDPKLVGESLLTYNFYSPKYIRELSAKEEKIDKILFKNNCESALKVLLEDKPMVEGCQKGLNENPEKNGILSDLEEIRILKFHETLKLDYGLV
jgi:phenylpropionate dioxygenase-like ring-hydroxylating dioxygenase large terminal subunit